MVSAVPPMERNPAMSSKTFFESDKFKFLGLKDGQIQLEVTPKRDAEPAFLTVVPRNEFSRVAQANIAAMAQGATIARGNGYFYPMS
jgi:hypothetical protein